MDCAYPRQTHPLSSERARRTVQRSRACVRLCSQVGMCPSKTPPPSSLLHCRRSVASRLPIPGRSSITSVVAESPGGWTERGKASKYVTIFSKQFESELPPCYSRANGEKHATAPQYRLDFEVTLSITPAPLPAPAPDPRSDRPDSRRR